MIPAAWRRGEVAVVGLARTGSAAGRWLREQDVRVYASDSADTPAVRAAADALAALGAAVDVGRHDLARIGRAAGVVASPGVPPAAPPLSAARAAGVEIVAELDLAARALRGTRLIVVTGTNGKTTTTALIAHVLTNAGISAAAAGNIGRPLIELALEPSPPSWAAVEASSFQLHDAPHLAPAIGVVTNLAPDHLDRYASVDDYYADKRRLFANAAAESIWVLNGDDAGVLGLAGGAPGRRRTFRTTGHADAWYDATSRRLVLDGAPLVDRDAFPLLGEHNIANALAAALAAVAAGATPAATGEALRSFRPLPHRLEPVLDRDGVLWINDSKATNLASTAVGVRAMQRPFVLILGGRHKGEPYTSLVPLLRERCRAVVAYGEAAPLVVRDLAGAMPVTGVDTLAAAVNAARRLALRGDGVLLSPACSSYDQFANYEERGAAFRRLAEAG